MEDDLYNSLIKTNQFKKYAVRLSKFHVPIDEARQTLISNLFAEVERYKKNHEKLHGSSFENYVLINAYHASVREIAYFRDHKKLTHNKQVYQVECSVIDEQVMNLAESADTRLEIDQEQFDLLVGKFFRKDTAQFISDVKTLSDGAMDKYGYSRSELDRRITNVAAIANRNREQINEMKITRQEMEMSNRKAILKEFIDLLESEDYADEKMRDLLIRKQNENIITRIMADVANNVTEFIQNFGRGNKKEEYAFVNRVYSEYERSV